MWDYLIVTSSNQEQAQAYEEQLLLRLRLGLIPNIRNVHVLSDPGGKRIGSGGSTIGCLLFVLNTELAKSRADLNAVETWKEVLQQQRILIIHAGGDSRRLPPYGPCGKLFIPAPGQTDSALGSTLFDRQLPVYLNLPPAPEGQGQVMITTGDVFLDFDPTTIVYKKKGITALACLFPPEKAASHGVFCPDSAGNVRSFLQKPSVSQQKEKKALDRNGMAYLDIGVMSLDAETAVLLLRMSEVKENSAGKLAWNGRMQDIIMGHGLDIFREVCCALGSETEPAEYHASVTAAGSKLEYTDLEHIYKYLHQVPFQIQNVGQCLFLHFGTMHQLIASGSELLKRDLGSIPPGPLLSLNNTITDKGGISGSASWVEGCRIQSEVSLAGENVLIGVDITEPLDLPAKTCFDIIKGKDRASKEVWFFRCYGIDDNFKKTVTEDLTIMNLPLKKWLSLMHSKKEEIWVTGLPDSQKSLWNARIYTTVAGPGDYSACQWMLTPENAPSEQVKAWGAADRYNLEEISRLADQQEFYQRRFFIKGEEIKADLGWYFRHESSFSAAELAEMLLALSDQTRVHWLTKILQLVFIRSVGATRSSGLDSLEFSRIIHTLASALEICLQKGIAWGRYGPALYAGLDSPLQDWLTEIELDLDTWRNPADWIKKAQEMAFFNLSRTIILSRDTADDYPRNALRSDEIIWGRAPARLDLGGGWTDTPPYSLENGGSVINAAVDLNGQPPIQVYVRTIAEPEIRIASIDHGARLVINDLSELSDYRLTSSKFGLAKAALVLSGFSLEKAPWPPEISSLKGMLELFGGGLELTTLAAIPSGSGLGTSSIMGAVILSVLARLTGTELSIRELFHKVLQLEQELTTGGGWQDQIGGTIEGVKLITSAAGLIPDPKIQYIPSDVLDPEKNMGQTLLYYTGLRRLAKNILRHVVGNYLDRSRFSSATLARLHRQPPLIGDAMAGKNLPLFGKLIDTAWCLNKEIDPDSSNPMIEEILQQIAPHLYGAKLLGAGGGGFFLLVARSAADAAAIRTRLEKSPPNRLARFFDFNISNQGLVVTVC